MTAPTRRRSPADVLRDAVDSLIQTTRIRVYRDGSDGYEWQTVPSLLTQLASSVGYQSGAGGSDVAKSRPTINAGAIDTLNAIRDQSLDVIRSLGGEPESNIPDTLRRACSLITTAGDTALVEKWTDLALQWHGDISAILRLNPERIRGIRGVACPVCGEKWVHVTVDGVPDVRQPALVTDWTKPVTGITRLAGEYEYRDSNPPVMLRAIVCQACDACWFRGHDLDQLMQQFMRDNLTHETLSIPPEETP